MESKFRLLLALFLHLLPVFGTSTLEFFSSKDCVTSLGEVNGTTDGVCHEAIANNAGARVIKLDQGCAATIYTDPFCSDSATIAQLNVCMSGSLVVGSFSIDCQTTQSSAAAFTANGPTPTASSQSAFSSAADTTSKSSGSSIPQAAVIAAVAGASVIAVSLLPICYFARRRFKKKKAARAGLAELKVKNISNPTELAAPEKVELHTPEDTRPPIPQLYIPRSSLSQRSKPMVSPLTPAPFVAQARHETQRNLIPIYMAHSPGIRLSPTTPEHQVHQGKTLPAEPTPQRPGSFAELGTGEPDPHRSPSGASNSTISGSRASNTGSAKIGTSYSSDRTLRDGGFF